MTLRVLWPNSPCHTRANRAACEGGATEAGRQAAIRLQVQSKPGVVTSKNLSAAAGSERNPPGFEPTKQRR